MEMPPDTPLAGRSVLIVDDHDDSRDLLRAMLENLGAVVTTSASVDEARRALARAIPDVLLTDLAMPVEDGFGLLDYCRQHGDPRVQGLPILALTGYGTPAAQHRVLAAGFDAYLSKPIDPSALAAVVSALAVRTSSSAP